MYYVSKDEKYEKILILDNSDNYPPDNALFVKAETKCNLTKIPKTI